MTEFFNVSSLLNNCKLSELRTSQDQMVNNEGNLLLDICKSNNLLILNGRCGSDKNIGGMTFRNQSVIDYSIVSYQALHFVKMFTLSDLDALFSDGHALISTTLQLQQTSTIENKTLKPAIKRRPKLPENRKFAFVENLNRSKIQELSSLINETSVNQALICKTKINSIFLVFRNIQ